MKKARGFLRGERSAIGSFPLTLIVTLLLAGNPLLQLQAADDPTAEADEAKKLLELFQEEGDTTNSLNAVMVWIPNGYRVAKTEITQAQYQDIMGKNPSKFEGASRPVEMVSPSDAKAFCSRLTQREHEAGTLPESFAYGLPTQKEFDTIIADTPLDTAFVSHIGDRLATTSVASLPPNHLGLHDVRGNVWEWCSDNVARGGSYQSHEDFLAPSFRFVGNANMRVMDIGFRIVLRETGP